MYLSALCQAALSIALFVSFGHATPKEDGKPKPLKPKVMIIDMVCATIDPITIIEVWRLILVS